MERKHIVLFISTLLVHHSSCQLAALFDPASQPAVTATEKLETSQTPDPTNPSSSLDQPIHDPPAALGVVGNDMTFPDSPPLDPLPPPLPPQDLHTFGPDQGASELSQIASELGLDINFFADPISSSDSLNQGSASTLFANDANAATPSIHSVDSPIDPVPEKQKSLTELSGSSSPSDAAPSSGIDIPPVGGPVEKPRSLSELMGSSPSTGTEPSTEIDPSSQGGTVDPIQEKPKSLADLMGSSVSTDTAPPADLSSVGGSTEFMHGKPKSLSEMMSSSSASSDSIGLPVSGGPMGSGGLNVLMNSANTNQSPLPHTDPAVETAARRHQQPQINDGPSALPLPTTGLGMPRSVSDPAFRLPSISAQANLPGSSPFEQLPQTAAGGQLGSNQLSGGLPQRLPQGQSPGGPFPFGIPGGMMGDPRFGFPSLPIGQQTQQSASPSNNQQTSSQQGSESNTEIGFQGTGNAQAIAGQPPVDPRTAGMFPPFMLPGFTGFQQGASAMQAPAGNPMSVNNAQSGQAGGTQDPGNEQLPPRVPMFPPFMSPAFLPQNVPGAGQPSNPAPTSAQSAANPQASQDPSQVQRNQQILPQSAMIPPFMSPAFFPQAVPGARQPSNPAQTSAQGAVQANTQTSQDPSQVQRNQQMLPQAAMIPSQMSSPFFPQHFPGLRPQTSQTSPGQSSVPRVTDSQIRRSEPSLPPRPPMFLTPGSQLPPITRTGEPLNPLRPQLPPTSNTLDRTQTSQADPSLLPRAEQVLREVESLVHDLRSSSRSTANLPTAGEGYCPNGNPRASCDVNPCDEVSCLNILDARCRPACDECSASFYVMERSGSQTSEKDVTDICMTVRWGRRRPGQGRTTSSTPTEPRGPVIEGPSGRRSNNPVLPSPPRGPDGRPLLLNPEDVIAGQSQIPRMPLTELFPRGFPRFPPGSPMDPRLPTRFQGLPGLPRSMLDPRLRRLGMRGVTAGVEQAGPGPIVLPEIARLIRGGQLDRRELNAIRSRSMVGLRPSGSSGGSAVSNIASRPSNARNEVEQALMRFERQASRRSV